MSARAPRTLTGRIAAISGGARGIGRVTAEALIARGVRVAIGDIDPVAAAETAAVLGAAARGYALDVSNLDSFTHFLDEAERDLGPLDIVINNAGIMPVGAFEDQPLQTVERQIDVNVRGMLYGTRLGLQRMRPRGRGHIVNMSSATGKAAYAGVATYAGTKHFVVGFSEGLRGELRGSGIDLTLVMPGFVATDLTTGLTNTRGAKAIAPQDVAAAVVAALEHPRFEVFVPRNIGPMLKLLSVLPRPVRDALGRAVGAENLGLKPDRAARACYDASYTRQR